MVILFFTAAIAGFVLGLRFKVLALAPAMVLGVAVSIASLAPHHHAVAILLGLFGTLTFLQLGYVLASVLQTYWPVQIGAVLQHHSWSPTRH
jgi:hypothetical protein